MRYRGSSVAVGLTVTLFAFVGVPTVFSAPHSSQQSCSPVCRISQDSSKLKYEQDNSYVYNFETKVSTKLVGTSDEESAFKIKGQAVISAQSPCDLILTVQQSKIEGPGGQKVTGENELEGSSIRFAFQDGAVEGLCIDNSESTWVTNFKRALVSMFQNKAVLAAGDATITEVDISGRCPTEYSFRDRYYTKRRDLNKCAYREGGKWLLQGIPYTSFSDQNSNPIVDSDLTCVQELSSTGVFNSIKCSETNKLKALSSGQAGAITIVDSKLTLAETKKGLTSLKSSTVFTTSSIIFDHANADTSSRTRSASTSNSNELLTKLCAEISSGTVSAKVPGLFLQLKKALIAAQESDYTSLLKKVQDGSICSSAVGKEKLEKLFIDAAISTGSSESIVLVAKLIEQGKLRKHTKEYFVLISTYTPRPQESALAAFRKLISSANSPNNVLLGAAGLLHQYCRTTNPDCASNAEYNSLARTIAQVASDNCEAQTKDLTSTKKALNAFQALGNLYSLPAEAVQAISTCMQSTTASNQMKIRALDSFRGDACQSELREKSFEIFKNKELTSELRIHAYLASVQCFQREDIDVMEKLIEVEESNQVGSFVTSHIANILSSSSPNKQGIRTLFKQIRIKKSFPFDPRVFSRNYELSAFSTERNVGFSAEGNLIYSQDSYIPRTTTGNLTVDLFGRSYQLFEYGLYLENFEKLFETYFGAAGLFSKNPQTEIVKELNSQFSHLQSGIRSRFKRDADQLDLKDIDAVHNKVSGIKTRFEENGGFGDIYVRALGLSILSESFTQEEIAQQTLSKSFLTILDHVLEGAKDHNVEITEPINFMDDQLVLPTISGFPLNLQTEGTTVLSLQLQGKLDILALLGRRTGADMEIKSRVLPSAATIIKAKMSVGAGPVESGLQLEGKIHSSSGIDVAIVRQANKFELKFNIPEEKIQLVDINTELFWVDQTGNTIMRKTPLKSKLEERSILDDQCTEALSAVMGLKLCANIKIPHFSTDTAPLFPLTGNSVVALSMKKVDASMMGYYLKFDSGREGDTAQTVSLILDTPGSKTNRKITAAGRYLLGQSPKFELNVASPWASVRVDYQRWNEELLQGVELNVKADQMEISGVAKLKHVPNGDIGITYEPTVSYSFPGASVELLSGSITRVFGKTMDIDLKAEGQLRAMQGKISGTVQINRKDSRNADFVLSSVQLVNEAIGQLLLDGNIGLEDTGSKFNLNAKYGLEAEHDLTLSGEFTEPKPKSKIIELKVASTRRKFLNFDIRYESARLPTGFENTMLIHRGSDPGTRLTLSQSSKYSWESLKQFDIENSLLITYPKRNLDFYLKADAKNGAAQSGNFQLRSGSAISSAITYDATGDDFSDYNLAGSLNYPGLHVKLSEIGKKVNTERWTYKSSFSSERDGQEPFKLDVDTDLNLRYQKNDLINGLEVKLTTSAFPEPFTFNSKVNARSDFYVASIKLAQPSGEILNLGTEYRAALGNKPPTISSQAFVLKYLDGKLTGKFDRASNLNLDVTWLPTNRRITVLSNLRKQGTRFNLNTDLKWDATRDQSKAANIKNSILLTSGFFGIETTNDFTIQGRQSQLILNGKLANDYFNGENSLRINYTGAGSATYGFGITNLNENRDKTKGVEFEVRVELPNQPPYEISLKNKASNMDFSNYLFELSTDVKLSNKNKNFNLQAELNSVQTNKRKVFGKWDISGSVISSALRFDHNIEVQPGHLKLEMRGVRGSKAANVEFETSYDLLSPKKTVEYNYKIETPFTSYRHLQMDSKYSYLFTGWTNFDFSQAGSVTVNNGNPSRWDNSISFIGQELLAKYDITSEGSPLILVRLVGNTKGFPNLNVKVTAESAQKLFESVDLRIKHKVGGKSPTSETQIQLKRSSNSFTITNKFENSLAKKFIDLTLTSSDNSPARKIFISLQEPNANKYSVDVLLRWGDEGKSIATKGELLRTGESGISGELTLDSPFLNAEGWNVHVAQDFKLGRQNLAITVKNGAAEAGHLILDYAMKGDDTLMRYNGTLDIKARAVNFEGNFQVDSKTFLKNRDGEEGREVNTIIHFSTENYPIKLEFLGKRTDADTRYSASFCNEGDQDCKIVEFSILTTAEDYTLSVISKSITGGTKSETDTFIVRTVRSGDNYEHSLKLRSEGDLEQEVGYKIYRYPRLPKAGLDIYLPQRRVLVSLSKRKAQYILEAWTDKQRKPSDKLLITFQNDEISRANDAGSWGREITLGVRHPNLPKDMQIKTRALYGGTSTLADITAEFDIFKTDQKLDMNLKVDQQLNERSEGGSSRVYTIDLGMHSPAQGLSIDVHSDIVAIGMQFTSKSKFLYMNREKQLRNYELVLDYVPDRRALEVNGPNGRIISYASSYNFHVLPGGEFDGYDVRREIFLPGMADTRIFQNSITTSFPPSAHIKMFTVNSPPGQFYESWIGFKNDKHFSSGFYSHEEQGQLVLGDFNVALNNSRLLFFKIDWEYENIKDFLTKTEARLNGTAERFKYLTGASADYLEKEIEYQVSSLLKALPTIRPLLNSYKSQAGEVFDEFFSAEIVIRHFDYIELILNTLGTDFEELKEQFDELTKSYTEMFENFQNFVDSIPALFDRAIEQIPAAWKSAQQQLHLTVDILVNTVNSAMRLVVGVFDYVSKLNMSLADNIGILSDTTQGAGKLLKETIESVTVYVADIWSNAKSAIQNLLESEPLKSIVMDLRVRYEKMLGDAIQGYKEQADAIRETIMKSVPQDEFRELASAIIDYAEKKTKKLPVDDSAAQKDIYVKFLAALQKASAKIFTVDLQAGLISAQIPLPVPVKSLLDMNQVFAISLPEKSSYSKFSVSGEDVWKLLSRIRSARDLLPPLESFAYIVGSQYYRTFDGKFYHFEGNCQYLLAADFAQKNFSIVVDFKKDTGSEVKKSILMTDNKNVVVIQPDNTVLLNGRPTEALYDGDYHIFQSGDWTTVEFGKSYIVECSKVQDVCAIQINGIYLGKTRGLLGTYNNEVYDDLMAPSGVVQKSYEEVVPLWKVDSQCMERPLPTHSLANNLDAIEMCRSAFSSTTALSPCFDTNNPVDFQNVCTSLAEEKGYDVKRAVCTAAYGYAKTCQNSGVDVDSTKFCS